MKLYHGLNAVAGRTYPQFSVVYREADGRRVRRRFNDLTEAKDCAQQTARRLAREGAAARAFSDQDRALYVQAVELLGPINRPLNLAVGEYVEAVQLLPSGVSLPEVVKSYLARTRHACDVRRIPDLVNEFIAAKERAGLSKRHLDDLRSRLLPFAAAFQVPADQVTGTLLQTYLDRIKAGARTRLNHLRHIVTLLRWSVRRKLAPRDLLDEIEAVDRPRPESGEIGILSPSEFEELLEGARRFRPALLGWIAVAGFCGLRTAELQRLEWRMVHLDRRFVEVPAARAKTRQRRLVPICAAAVDWLSLAPSREGLVSPYSEENKVIRGLVNAADRLRGERGAARFHREGQAQAAGPFRWVKNGLRHSFCSYRLAQIHDVGRVALEAGNSAQMIFQHYREVVTEEEARAWFDLRPAIELSKSPREEFSTTATSLDSAHESGS